MGQVYHPPENPPESYRPKPYSKSFVRHLDNWYAQAEPDEDFAETFAVWLTPESNWREYYRGWPALQKLKCIDVLMQRLAGRAPLKIKKDRSFASARSRLKLKDYYARKQRLYAQDYPDFYDRDLNLIFSTDGSSGDSAGEFMRKNRRIIVEKVAQWSGEKKFIVNNLFKKLLDRSRQLKMRLRNGQAETLLEVSAYLTSMVSNYLYTGKFKPTV